MSGADRDIVTGSIDKPNNDYTVKYTNKWNTQDFSINKVDDEGNFLPGATFTLTKGNDIVRGFDPDDLNADGRIENIKLGFGVYCLTETAAPAGYNILSDKVYFKIQKGATNNNYEAVLCDAEGNTDGVSYENASISNTGLTVIVANTPGSELPMTGGPGTALFNILGSAIATAAVLTYLLLSRRTSEGRSWV